MNDGRSSIWRLHILANDYRSFIPHDLRWFADKFRCRPLGNGWTMPPAEVCGVSKPLGDFISWGLTDVFIVGERARAEIERLDRAAIEFLPFHKLGRHRT